MKKKLIASFGIFSTALVMSGCSPFSGETEDNTQNENREQTAEQENQASYPIVEVIQSKRSSIIPEITLTGTITTKDEITIASEVTGTVQKVFKKEGDSVSINETLMSLESQTNLLRASYSSANIALVNAKRGLTLAKKSAQQNLKDADLQIKNAELAVKNAEIAYKRIKDSLEFKKNSNSANKENSDKMLEITEKNLEIAQQSLKNIQETISQTNIRFMDAISSNISATLLILQSNLDFIDSLVGASEFREHDNDSFEVYLAGSSGTLIQEIQNEWRIINPEITTLENTFQEFEQLKYSIEDKPALLEYLNTTLENTQKVQNLLRDLESMLEKSISSTTFPESQITSLKAQTTQFQAQLTEQAQSLKDLRQSINEFETTSSQQINDAELAITVRESEVLAQQSQNSAVENTEGSTNVSIDSELETAKNAYLNAQNALASSISQKVSIGIQGELAIQSAIAQVDASQSMLDQAALSLSKLQITSGIKGTVSKVLAFAGDTVSPGTPLFIISDFSELKLISDVSLEESFLIKKGMKANVSIDGVDKVFVGKISLIYPEADKLTRRVRVEIVIPNTEKIPANVFSTAHITLPRERPEVYVPRNVLISENPPSIFIAVKKECLKDEEKTEVCQETYNNQQIYIVNKKILALKNTEETEFGFPVNKGLRPNEFILTKQNNTLFEGDEIVIKKEEDKIEDKEEREEKTQNI